MAETRASMEMVLAENLNSVRESIADACKKTGRDPAEVTLVAVTKTHPAWVIDELVRLGAADIGENRVQPALAKARNVQEKATWHMIGHLQRNKVRKALELFSTVHSVDSVRLADRLDAETRALGRDGALPVYLEVNVSGETSKYGVSPEEAGHLADHCQGLAGLRLQGLMTMAPYSDDAEKARPTFSTLRELGETLGLPKDARGLSMGMSGDYVVAVEEGATVVRVGTALLTGVDT